MLLKISIIKISCLFYLLALVSIGFFPLNQSFAQGIKPETDSEKYFLALLDSSNFFSIRDFKKALNFADQARDFAESEHKPDLTVKVLNQYGSLYFKIGLMDLASESYLKSSDLLDSFQDKDINDLLLNRMGLSAIHLHLKNFDKSKELLTYSLHLLDSIHSPNLLFYSSVYNNLGIIHREQGDFVQAYTILEKGIKLLESKDHQNRNLPFLYNNLGEVYLRMKNYEDAMTYYQRSLDFRKGTNDLLGIATTNKNLGLLYEHKGEKNSDELEESSVRGKDVQAVNSDKNLKN